MAINNKIRFDDDISTPFGIPQVSEPEQIFQSNFVYGINNRIWNTPIINGTGASVDTNASRLRIQSGTASGNYSYIESKKYIVYRAGIGNEAKFTAAFTTGVANQVQFIGVAAIINNAIVDGFGFGYSGTSFGIYHINNSVVNFIPSTSFIEQQYQFDPTKLTPMMIKYPFLGAGNVNFFILDYNGNSFNLIHTIKYSNTTTNLELSNPSLKFVAYTKTNAAVSNMTMYVGSVGVFLSAKRNFIGAPKFAYSNNKTSITTEAVIFNLRNASTLNSINNRGMIRLSSVSTSINGGVGTIGIVRLLIGSTLGGSPNFTGVDGVVTNSTLGTTITGGTSFSSYDTAGTINVRGKSIYEISLPADGNIFIDLHEHEIILTPGDLLTVTAFATNSATFSVSLNWFEDY